jgi:hypothetical protein
VPPLGLLFDCLLSWITGSFSDGPLPDWAWPTVLAVSFAGAAVIAPIGRWTSRDAPTNNPPASRAGHG